MAFRFFSFEYHVTQDSKQILSEQLVRVRALAQSRLAKFSRLDPADCKEVYLFKADQFCGIRLSLGAFQAVWRIDQPVLNVFRGTNQIDRVEIESAEGKQAA